MKITRNININRIYNFFIYEYEYEYIETEIGTNINTNEYDHIKFFHDISWVRSVNFSDIRKSQKLSKSEFKSK